jgi:hypothetical protein
VFNVHFVKTFWMRWVNLDAPLATQAIHLHSQIDVRLGNTPSQPSPQFSVA